LDFNISVCERVMEWTFKAHWVSLISPRNICGFSSLAWASRTTTNSQLPAPARVLRVKSSSNLLHDQQSHIHAFVIFAANYCAYHYIFTRFGGSGQLELLLARAQ
jgi:hypothetical protein